MIKIGRKGIYISLFIFHQMVAKNTLINAMVFVILIVLASQAFAQFGGGNAPGFGGAEYGSNGFNFGFEQQAPKSVLFPSLGSNQLTADFEQVVKKSIGSIVLNNQTEFDEAKLKELCNTGQEAVIVEKLTALVQQSDDIHSACDPYQERKEDLDFAAQSCDDLESQFGPGESGVEFSCPPDLAVLQQKCVEKLTEDIKANIPDPSEICQGMVESGNIAQMCSSMSQNQNQNQQGFDYGQGYRQSPSQGQGGQGYDQYGQQGQDQHPFGQKQQSEPFEQFPQEQPSSQEPPAPIEQPPVATEQSPAPAPAESAPQEVQTQSTYGFPITGLQSIPNPSGFPPGGFENGGQGIPTGFDSGFGNPSPSGSGSFPAPGGFPGPSGGYPGEPIGGFPGQGAPFGGSQGYGQGPEGFGGGQNPHEAQGFGSGGFGGQGAYGGNSGGFGGGMQGPPFCNSDGSFDQSKFLEECGKKATEESGKFFSPDRAEKMCEKTSKVMERQLGKFCKQKDKALSECKKNVEDAKGYVEHLLTNCQENITGAKLTEVIQNTVASECQLVRLEGKNVDVRAIKRLNNLQGENVPIEVQGTVGEQAGVVADAAEKIQNIDELNALHNKDLFYQLTKFFGAQKGTEKSKADDLHAQSKKLNDTIAKLQDLADGIGDDSIKTILNDQILDLQKQADDAKAQAKAIESGAGGIFGGV